MTSPHDATHESLFPVVVEEIDLVRVEKSLHSLGFFASTTNREISRTVAQVFRRPDGQKVHAKAVIEGIPSLGLPTTADRDKYMAFMKIAQDQRETEGQLTNPVRFAGADMIKLLRLRKGGFHYDEINDWCKRMVATTIMSEASVFLADRKQYATDTFHVFDRVVLVGEQLHDGSRSEYYQVFLSTWQLANLNQGYLLPLDFNAYLGLRRDIAKALFGHLSVWFYASKGQTIEKKYSDLCQVLNIRAYPHVSKARSVLEPSMDELIRIGYLASWDLVRTSRGADLKLVLSPGDRLLSLPHFEPLVTAEERAALESRLPDWVPELVSRGVAERKARQLALDITEDQPVLDQIEYAEYLVQRDARGKGRISNAPGFLIWAIENNLAVPKTFETTRKRKLLEARYQAEDEQHYRYLQLETEYQEFCEEQVAAALRVQFPADKLDAAIRDRFKVIKREQPEWFAVAVESERREVALARLRAEIRQSLDLPTFEHWSKRDLQQRLF
ncbi:MAG: replication initiator protein A [Fimbriimonadaceae bacterium]|nr:replication initiator protein A [Fimbriimonadaceae bacterium]